MAFLSLAEISGSFADPPHDISTTAAMMVKSTFFILN